ncbi:MAG: UvrD-helicase domain-containing protein [Patescibacteria group bacterium]|nr:UvrD-helicase domain-containing protein [Patescibacteria group bacterium]
MKHRHGLNKRQEEAVLAIDGPVMVIAGAGAGKTKVLAARILEIISRGVAPEHILAITFTNKAAGEMRSRVLGGLGSVGTQRAGHPFISTFHSLGLSIIKERHATLGLPARPAIWDRSDSMREIKKALRELGEEDIEPRAALGIISKFKGDGTSPAEYAAGVRGPWERAVARAWEKYEVSKRAAKAVDFDDLLVLPVELLRREEAARGEYRARWRYILIDEYQDTNALQAELAALLLGAEKNIFVVGDIDQTIYSWRGAQIKNLLRFEESYPGTRVVLLEENYRSTKNILDAANALIEHNQNRVEKVLLPTRGVGETIGLYQAFDERDEAGFVARKVRELMEAGRAPRDIAVLYRANFQSRALEEQFLAADLPYQVLGTRFFDRKEVKDALSWLRAALTPNPQDIERAVSSPSRGIGKVTLMKMLRGEDAGPKAVQFYGILARLREAAHHAKPSDLLKLVIAESGLEKMYREDKFEGAERLGNLRELVSLGARFDEEPAPKGIEDFLESAALQSEQDEIKEERNVVRLMTVHASKGLEFPVVFIVGLEEGLFPYESELEEERDPEEERRLMYVALTRAKEKVYLCYASYRTVFGSKSMGAPSQFLSELPGDILELEGPERLGKTIYLD